MAAFIDLPPDEKDLVARALAAESFRAWGYQQHGAHWIYHIPTDINIFVWRYFGCELLNYQLAAYYCPVPNGTVHGGRGSGKTEGFSMVQATYTALHPGEDTLVVSVTKDQAAMSFRAVLRLGAADGTHPRFVERFIDDWRVAPFPDLMFKRWDDADRGSIIRYRGLGDENIERLRSYEAGSAWVDEAFRTVADEATYLQLRGCLRGPNRYMLAQLDPAARNILLQRMYNLASIRDPDERAAEEEAQEAYWAEHGLAKRNFLCLYGNAGPARWAWRRHRRARSDPDQYWSWVATSYDNPFLGMASRKALEAAYRDDPELRSVEMMAREPRSLGIVFRANQLNRCLNLEAEQEVKLSAAAEIPGYDYQSEATMGCYLYQRPAVPEHLHVIGADPGTGQAPERNKWVICVFDISQQPCPLVYFEMGYISRAGVGDYTGFFARLQIVQAMYPTAPHDTYLESTGPQKGMGQLVYPDGLAITPVDLTATKPIYINYTIQLLGHQLLELPDLETPLAELGNYDYQDKKLVQDCVMALICAAVGIWRYYGNSWSDYESGADDPAVSRARAYRSSARRIGVRRR